MIIERKGALPNRHTFLIKPIKEFVDQYFCSDEFWIDPFCGYYTPVAYTHRNDLNPEVPAKWHLEAKEFLQLFSDTCAYGVILDPPYSLRQLKECYKSVGIEKIPWEMTKGYPSGTHGREIHRIMQIGGILLKFGWNSSKLTKNFEVIHVLIVNHGGNHYDTICTAQVKIR